MEKIIAQSDSLRGREMLSVGNLKVSVLTASQSYGRSLPRPVGRTSDLKLQDLKTKGSQVHVPEG